MGKKTKFINKETSQKFHLLHRSQTDAAYAGDEVPSEFVLVAANEANTNASRKKRVVFGEPGEGNGRFRDHITKEGFANDGYDYTQHLREMGGGRFIGRDGRAQDIDFSYNEERIMELPEDALPSTGEELERDLEAITISHELMDDDIRNALFEDADDDGEFEELQDDFVTQVMEAPVDTGFDYEAHIATLIARSEEKLGINRARGWENGSKHTRIGKSSHDNDLDRYGEDDNEEEWVSDGGEFDDEVPETAALSEEQRRRLEQKFEDTLAEYDDEEIGELYDDEEEMEGGIELDGDNAMFNHMIDEFLQDQKDQIYAEGTLVAKGNRSTTLVRKGQNAAKVVDQEVFEAQSAPADLAKESAEQQARQEESLQYLRDLEAAGETHKELETCQMYLAETRVEERWDCETVLSTYSTLDNHPALIKDTNTRFRPYKSHHERSLEHAANISKTREALGIRSAVERLPAGTGAAPQIVLSGKLGLPDGYGRGDAKSTASKKLAPKVAVSRSVVESIKEVEVTESESEGPEEEEDSEGDEGGERPPLPARVKEIKGRSKAETAEEKRVRKQQVKQEQKAKRSSKKELRTAYAQEGSRLNRVAGREQSTDHVSIFKYSA